MKSILSLLFICAFLNHTLTGQINHEWSFSIGSKGSEGSGGSVVDHAGNIYILMEMKDTADVDPGPGIVQIVPEQGDSWILTKYDADGNLVFGNPFFTDENAGGSVLEAKFNQVRLVINFHDSLVYAQNGIREKLYENPGNNTALITLDLGGNITDSYFYSSPEDSYIDNLYTFPDGRTLIDGSFTDTLVFNPQSPVTLISKGEGDAFFMMLDDQYVPIWNQHFSGPGYDYINSAFVWQDERIYFTGGYEDTLSMNTINGPLKLIAGGEEDPFFGYFSLTGDLEKVFTIKGIQDEDMRDIRVDAAGNMYVVGYFEGLVNFANPAQLPVLHIAVSEGDGYIGRFSPDGHLDWLGIYTNTEYGGAYTIELKRENELYVSGTFAGTADINPGPDSLMVTTGFDSSPFISKLNTDGELLWSVPFYTNEVAGIRELSVLTEDSRIVVNGFFYDSLQCGTVAGENWLGTKYGADCFVASYSEENVMTASHDFQKYSPENFNIYPNPAMENISIQCNDELIFLSLYNASGELIKRMDDVYATEVNMNLAELPAGIYYLQGNSKDKIITGKVTKQ
jgi:hypothetical protein